MNLTMNNTIRTTEYSYATDKKWQEIWEETHLYRFDKTRIADKHFLLEMFCYPSGKNLHIGHWWNYSQSDNYGRLKRMQGYEVFHPPGFDAFGLPAENFAVKSGIHPEDSTKQNIATMNRQFRAMGTTYDWEHEIITCEPAYYKWTQWLFLKLFERGLAYRKEAPVNWCPSCMTVLANEQVVGGLCERCETEVTAKNMTQWFFKITDYSEELLRGLSDLDWPEKTKKIQENWIGKSYGCEIDFITGSDRITVYTTRADTLMGVTYIVLAPEHPLVERLTTPENAASVRAYRAQAGKTSEIERTSTAKEKTGVPTGAFAIHPISGKQIPVWVADYVLVSYGTGAVMAVPAHDERDYAFAAKYGLPVIPVIKTQTQEQGAPEQDTAVQGIPAQGMPFCADGVTINSAVYDGLSSSEARDRISNDLSNMNLGRPAIKYKLRDWLVSRQRYWGAPIPIIYCDDCGAVPVPESELPVVLPHDVAFMPTGQSPLASCAAFINTVCPICGKPAKRDTDTLDTFVCSSWYFLRFFDPNNSERAFDPEDAGKIMPVDKYVGGVEHAAMHLLYARFVTKALRDMGYLHFDEPFTSLVHQGIIQDADGRKMSKRSGAVSPDSIVEQYGVDVFRMYLGFGFSFLDGGPWSPDGIKAIDRFVKRICRVFDRFIEFRETGETGGLGNVVGGKENRESMEDKANVESPASPALVEDRAFEYIRHNTIRQVTENIERFQFNSAIARIMEYINALWKYQGESARNLQYEESIVKDLILLLAPLAPHLAEELWSLMGYEYSVHNQKWPQHDVAKLLKDIINIAVQVNGNLKSVVKAPADANETTLRAIALEDKKVRSAIGGQEIRKVIIVKHRLINFVC